MEWTSEKPKVAGWYWYRLVALREVVCVYEYKTVRHPLRVQFIDGTDRSMADCHGHWAGPIQPPKEG
jgi:hypothetical protein